MNGTLRPKRGFLRRYLTPLRLAPRRTQLSTATVLLLLSSVLLSTVAQANSKTIAFRDDFSSGFSIGSANANWFHFGIYTDDGIPLFVGDDGAVTTDKTGLRVRARGTNPATGQPAFTSTLGQETNATDNPYGLPGAIDHVKWLVYANRVTSRGIPGFEAQSGRELIGSASVAGQTFGTQQHPFGSAVRDPNTDYRLAAVAFNGIDFESWMVFDFFVTNDQLYAVYERLPFGRSADNNYAAFTFVVPLMKRKPGTSHDLQIGYDRSAGVVRWIVDGKEHFRVSRIGYHIDRKYMTIDHGGVEQLAVPQQLAFGMGMFTLLDAHLPTGIGLVRLSTIPDFYFNPSVGEPTPQTFVDEQSASGSRLFGQGAELRVKYVEVSSEASGTRSR